MSFSLTDDLVRSLDPSLFQYARARVHHDEQARDLVQDTWTSAVQAIAGFAGRSSLRTWLTTILHRKIVDFFRAPSHLEFVDGVDDDSLTDLIANKESLRLFEKVLPTLTEHERSVFFRVDIDGEDQGEVATSLGMSRPAVRVTLHRARQKMRDAAK